MKRIIFFCRDKVHKSDPEVNIFFSSDFRGRIFFSRLIQDFFFVDKNKTIFIHSNRWITSNTNIAKNIKGEFANKLTTPKLIT